MYDRPMMKSIFLIFLMLGLCVGRTEAQPDLPGCAQRPTSLSQPWISSSSGICLEEVVNDPNLGELAFTSLAVTPDNVLFAARPHAGEVWMLTDFDGDGLPETPELAASGLTLPNALVYYDGALYISGGAHLYRLQGGILTTLVDDLPSGGGLWAGGVAVYQGRIFIGIGAPCDGCDFDAAAQRGSIISVDLEGGDRRIEARGLRYPADLVVMDGAIWVVDSARDGLFDQPDMDELNRFFPGETPHFGFPGCVGIDNQPDIASPIECTNAAAPVLTFPTGSRPLGLAVYPGGSLAAIGRGLLVALGGSYNETELRGYRIALVRVDENGNVSAETLLPVDPEPGNPVTAFTIEQINYRDSGLWRRRPYDVAVNAWGWVYISLSGGRILALRP
jgi:glucose/arabinose dehydrogenase